MDSRSNKVLLGVILLLLGIVSLAQNFLNINYKDISLFIVGFAFIMLYKTKKKSWSLILGVYMLYFSTAHFLNSFGFPNIITSLIGSLFFGVPGVIFLILFFDKNKRGLLIPSSILIWISIYTFIFKINNGIDANMFLFCMGMAFCMIYLLGKDFIGKWSLYLGSVLTCVSLFTLIKGTFLMEYVPTLSSVFLIVLGLFMILAAIFKKNRKNQ